MFNQRVSRHLFLLFFVLVSNTSYSDEPETPRQVFTQALKKGDLSQVQSMIESSAVGIEEVPENDYKGLTPLVEAAGFAQIPIMKYLIGKGASVNGVSGKKSTPLTQLIETGSAKLSCPQLKEVVHFLMDSGADINYAGENGYTPLMNACKYTRCIDLVEMFLDLGALANVKADDENTAFTLTIRNTNVKAFRLLISRDVNTAMGCKGLSPLGIAAEEGNVVMAKLILEELKMDVNKYDPLGGTPICWAALNGQDAMVAFLAEKGADINAKTVNAINVEKEPDNVFVRFVKTYVTFPKNCTALTFAKWRQSISTVNLISDLGGVEFGQFELKEWTDYGFGRFR